MFLPNKKNEPSLTRSAYTILHRGKKETVHQDHFHVFLETAVAISPSPFSLKG